MDIPPPSHQPTMSVACPVAPASASKLQMSTLRTRSRLTALRERLEVLHAQLAEQVELLPIGNESWIETERELRAAESAMAQLHGRRWI